MKEKLLQAIHESRAREGELVALCTDGPANADGRWNAKDHLIHLAWWRTRNARLIEAVRTRTEPPQSVEDDEQNAVTYAENRDRSLADIKADAEASWAAMAAAVEASSEEDLALPHPYAPRVNMAVTVTSNTDFHLGQHLMFWYLEHGDESRAEAAQVWVRDIEDETFDDSRRRATAAYNLGCFYARVGRANEALALLRAGFESRPELVDLARTDPDLDPIRENPELKEVLGN